MHIDGIGLILGRRATFHTATLRLRTNSPYMSHTFLKDVYFFPGDFHLFTMKLMFYIVIGFNNYAVLNISGPLR
jgi:hypothetical protein